MNEKRDLEKKKVQDPSQDKKLKLTPAMQSIMDQDYQYSSSEEEDQE